MQYRMFEITKTPSGQAKNKKRVRFNVKNPESVKRDGGNCISTFMEGMLGYGIHTSRRENEFG